MDGIKVLLTTLLLVSLAGTSVAGGGGGGGGGGDGGGGGSNDVYYVEIINSTFYPHSITIGQGNMIIWYNRDTIPQRIFLLTEAGMAGSGDIQEGQTYSYTFSKAGNYRYSLGYYPSNVYGEISVIPLAIAKSALTPTETPIPMLTPTPAKTSEPQIQTPSKTTALASPPTPIPATPASESQTNWTLFGGALLAILLIGAVALRLRKPKETATKKVEKLKEIKAEPFTNLEILRGYSVLSNNDIKFGVRLTNNTNFVITDTDVILDYSKNLFSTKDHELQHLGNITPTSARTATYILKPLGCIHNEQINALITYKDLTGKKQTLNMRPKEVHCVCPFLKEKPMSESEYSRLATNSQFVQEGISFKGISVEDLAKFMGETCRHMLYKVREYDLEGKKVIYLSGESVGEKAYYLLTAVIQEYKGLTQVVLRAYSDNKHGLNGFMNEMADSIRHLVGSVQNAKEIGIIENTQVVNIIDSVVQRTSFNMGEGGSTQVIIKDSIVQRSNIGRKD